MNREQELMLKDLNTIVHDMIVEKEKMRSRIRELEDKVRKMDEEQDFHAENLDKIGDRLGELEGKGKKWYSDPNL